MHTVYVPICIYSNPRQFSAVIILVPVHTQPVSKILDLPPEFTVLYHYNKNDF